MPKTFDRDVILRTAAHIKKQLDDLAREMTKRDDEYSPLMAFDEFQQKYEEAIGYDAAFVCCFPRLGPHRCGMRERIVEAYMNSKRKKAA